MAAYAALVSVMQILDQLQVTSPPPISIDKTQLLSLTQKLAFLQQFLEGYSSHVGYTEEADPMESRIADAAYAAEDVIESHIVAQILARSTNHGEEISSMEFYQSLQTVINEMELIEVEAMEIKQKKGVRDQLHMIKSATHAGSSVRAAPKTPITVGFDDVLLQMLDKITGERPDRQIIPIVGMGGIDAEDILVLRNLHTLSTVTNLICGEDVVSRIPNIKILKLSYDEEFMEASPCLNNLRHLHKLETLAIRISFYCDSPSHLVHNISFPHSLKWLKLDNTELQWEDVNTKIGPLPLLQVLKLKFVSFIGSEWETLEGQFCSLKFLLIDGCGLEQWVTDNTHFPRLQHLVLGNMRGLREIPSSMGDIPTLRSIELAYCREFAVDSAKRIQEEQEDYGNTDLKLIIKGVWNR